MKKKVLLSLLLVTILVLGYCCFVQADGESKKSGLFSYQLKGNGTAVITGFDWKANGTNDIYVPRMIDGYTVTEIGPYAFSSNDTKTSTSNPVGTESVVILPDTITVLGEKAFFCTNITSISIPASVQFIDAGAFAGCQNISQFALDSNNSVYATIDGVLYNKVKKELVAVPYAKYNSSKQFKIPNGIVSIGPYAFYDIDFLRPTDAAISSVSFPDSLISIGNYAFAFSSLYAEEPCPTGYRTKTFSLNKVKSIGDYAFWGCTSMLFSWEEVETIGDYAFADSRFEIPFTEDHILSLPSSLISIGKGSFSNCRASSLYMGSDSKFAVLDLQKTKIVEIPDEAFADFGLDYKPDKEHPRREIKLPSSLEYIGKNAFQYVSLDYRETFRPAYITLPSKLKEIDEYAFDQAGLIISMKNAKSLEKIGDYAFHWACFFLEDNEILVLPENVKEIGEEAFNGQAISALQIPDSTTSIGKNVCDRSKTKIVANSGSYAALYASENGFPFEAIGGEDTSWLND